MSIGTAIYITDIATTEHVTVLLGNTLYRTYLSSVNIHFGLTKHITIGIEFVTQTVFQLVIALTTTEHVAEHKAVEHLDMCLTILIDLVQITDNTR